MKGNVSVVAKLYPLSGSGDPVRFWADAGRISWRDPRDGTHGTMSCEQAEERIEAVKRRVNGLLLVGDTGKGYRRMAQFLEDMAEVLRRAKAMRADIRQKMRHLLS